MNLGGNTTNYTAINQLFLENPSQNLWRFEVVYQFATENSSSSLNFIINTPPSNGSCEINPSNGTTNTLFNISCSNWFDDDTIKDYLLYCSFSSSFFFSYDSFGILVWEDDPSKLTFISYSSISTFQVHFPSGNLNLIVHIRDMADCNIAFNLSSIVVQLDLTETFNLMNNLTNRNKNPLVRLLSSRNPNIVGQVLSSVSQQLNQMNKQTIEEATSSNY